MQSALKLNSREGEPVSIEEDLGNELKTILGSEFKINSLTPAGTENEPREAAAHLLTRGGVAKLG